MSDKYCYDADILFWLFDAPENVTIAGAISPMKILTSLKAKELHSLSALVGESVEEAKADAHNLKNRMIDAADTQHIVSESDASIDHFDYFNKVASIAVNAQTDLPVFAVSGKIYNTTNAENLKVCNLSVGTRVLKAGLKVAVGASPSFPVGRTCKVEVLDNSDDKSYVVLEVTDGKHKSTAFIDKHSLEQGSNKKLDVCDIPMGIIALSEARHKEW